MRGGQTNDTDRMERSALEELGLDRAGVAVPVTTSTTSAGPDRQRTRWATPAAVPQISVRSVPDSAPVTVKVRELLPLPASAWGYRERVWLAAPPQRAAPVVRAAATTNHLQIPLVAAGVLAVAVSIAAVSSLNGRSTEHGRDYLPSLSVPSFAAASDDAKPPTSISVEAVAQDEATDDPQVVVSPISTTVLGRFTTEPLGAIVTLVDNGEARVLGSSPVSAELDPEHTYELLVEHAGHWSDVRLIVLEAQDETASEQGIREHVELTALKREQPAKTAVAAKKAPIRRKAKSNKSANSAAAAGKARKGTKSGKSEVAGNKGILMLHAKPPCDIEIDGRDTGLTTPRRDIKLAAGKHRITLVNREHNIRENLTVTIRAGRAVRVSRDLTSRLTAPPSPI